MCQRNGSTSPGQVHAEQSLLANAAWHGESALERLAVSAAPCGHCRQFYSELACAVRILAWGRIIGAPLSMPDDPSRRSLTLLPACHPGFDVSADMLH